MTGFRAALAVAASLWLAGPAVAAPLTAAQKTSIDQVAAETLKSLSAPSASLAVVTDGKLDYVQAYGLADLRRKVPAQPAMRYAIGSISKQFTAAAVLMLVEEGKLSLDDPVSRWFPDITSASGITVRNLLSHTSGYADFWPQDYVMAPMTAAKTPDALIAEWATKPLQFEPGTRYEYSNTGFVIAGRIVEKVSGEPLFAFLQKRVFTPLGMTSVVDFDKAALFSPPDAAGYRQAALAGPRPALVAGPGWGLSAFELAMTAQDLALWDISLMNRSLLKPASYDELYRSSRLKDGREIGYSLGLTVSEEGGRKRLSHSGEVAGFTAINRVYPSERDAIVVLTNFENDAAAAAITTATDRIVLPVGEPAVLARINRVLDALSHGRAPARADVSDNLMAYSDAAVRADFASSLGPLGAPRLIYPLDAPFRRGGMTGMSYQVEYAAGAKARISLYALPDGRFEQFLVMP